MLLYLKIKPNQHFDRIEKLEGDWVIRLKAPAIDGKANQHLIDYLSEIFKLLSRMQSAQFNVNNSE